ncbi:hypothetical protein SASPL_115664 [Salvia splendens]|uniref:DNA polymerase III subunit gamma/tau n=1 Tax=Salvia splendens TaxID=180675 RepID=A0A8X9A0I0_SALSN|nr:hypothetical protein SASPL_115664 [Salvia splendens]
MDSSYTLCIRLRRKKKSARSGYSSPDSRQKLQMKMLLSRYFDENGGYCNSEDLGRDSAVSQLLARFKNNKGWSCPPVKMTRSHRKEDDSVPYSTRALLARRYNRYAIRNPSTVDSWVGMTGSFDDEVDDQRGCGIPCYWSRRSTPRSRNGSSCSPSLSDVLRRKGSSLLCGSQTMSQQRHQGISLRSNKRKLNAKLAALLLDNGADGSSLRTMEIDDELTAKLAELDLEGMSRLAGRRLRSSRLEFVARESFSDNIKSLSHKYRPMCFEDLIGQNMVVQSLARAVSRGRITPSYLFQGPRGVGKKSMARIFAAALNCLATDDSRSCGACMECADFLSGKCRFIEEVDCSNNKGVEGLKDVLRNISVVHPSGLPHCRVILSLFGKQITKSLVNELMGVVSEDKLLELLELAMSSSNATETVRRSREVMDSGVDPLVLISQLVTLIVDIIAGTHLSVDAKHDDSIFGWKT